MSTTEKRDYAFVRPPDTIERPQDVLDLYMYRLVTEFNELPSRYGRNEDEPSLSSVVEKYENIRVLAVRVEEIAQALASANSLFVELYHNFVNPVEAGVDTEPEEKFDNTALPGDNLTEDPFAEFP